MPPMVRLPRLSVLLAAVIALIQAAAVAVAQDASPAAGSAFEGLGLPEFRITLNGGEIERPAEVAAGRYLVVLDNRSPYVATTVFVLPPAGLTLAQVQATPETEELPAWLSEATLAAGVSVEPGGTAWAVLDLAPAGDWFIQLRREPDESTATPPPADLQLDVQVPFSVTGEAPSTAPIPADLTVRMQEFDFVIPDSVPTGSQVWEVTNAGDQYHHLNLYRLPGPITDEQLIEALELQFGLRGDDATPSPGLPDWAASGEPLEEVAFVPFLSTGRSAWIEVDLAPGTYAAMCFVTDPHTGMWHALLGMVEVFDAGATPGA